ncbi:MAG: hypothetical protein QHH05_06125 [Syntrophomonadaceae bacterium]|nr:hypothetical protein [Syntrophomonadaceae bacterium]MDH7498005.1 hypothetical protein [Syntrophomonadaceae bacterium]
MGTVTIFAGGFGSGKTETAINYAIELAHRHQRVILADLDLVNPYFCSREAEAVLSRHGVRVVAPAAPLRLADVPQVPAETVGFLRAENEMVLDVGGDEVGAWVLGYLRQAIVTRPYRMLLVLNPFRPFATTVAGVAELRQALERASRIGFTGVVSNPNLASATDRAAIEEGHARVQEYARVLGLPVEFLVVEERFRGAVSQEWAGVPVRVITRYLEPEWM